MYHRIESSFCPVLEAEEKPWAISVVDFPRSDRRRLVHALVEWLVDVEGSRGYNYAEATAGGVSLDEIDPATMSSRKCPGLYLVGKMGDVDRRIGRGNFQCV